MSHVPQDLWVTTIAFSPKGDALAIGRGRGEDGDARIVNVADGKTIRAFPTIKDRGHVRSLAFDSTGERMISSSYSSLVLWDVSGTRKLLEWPSAGIWGDDTNPTQYAAVSSDGQYVAASEATGDGHRLRIFATDTSLQTASIEGISSPLMFVQQSHDVIACSTPVGKAIPDESEKRLVILKSPNWTARTELNVPCSVLGTSNVQTAAVRSGTGVSVVDLRDGREISKFGSWGDIGPGILALSPDSRIVAAVIVEGGSRSFGAGGERGISIEIWDTREGKALLKETAESGFSIETAAFSPDGRYLAWGGAYFGGARKGTGLLIIVNLSSRADWRP